MRTARAPAACTIIARNYLSYATVLAESYRRHEPEARFYLLVVDGLPPDAHLPPDVQLVDRKELALPGFFEMCFKYDVTELCTAVKPAFLSLLLNRYGEPSVAYFDPDILVLRPLEELKAAVSGADIVLIPHLLDPIPRDGRKPSEQDILIAGAYNLGFLALKASPEANRLLEWWGDRLEDGCRVDPAHGLFVDQRWMDLAPSLFPSAAVLRDPGYDVAYWNLHSRMVERGEAGFEVAGRPLSFFHFSGFDPRKPQQLSKHQTRIGVSRGSALAELLELYAELHQRHGHATCSSWTYGYSRFSNGAPVNLVFRRLYLGLDDAARQRFGNPFDAEPEGSFYRWAVRPDPELGGLNRFLEALYVIRTDLPGAFPDHRGKDRTAFLEWARAQGSREMDFPTEIVPGSAAAAPAAHAAPGSTATPASAAAVPGVNVAGYLRNETGIGAVARGYVAALRAAGVPVALKDFSGLSPNRSEDATLGGFDEVHPYPVNLVCANADQHFVVASHLGPGFLRQRRNVAVWFWELPDFPAEWHDRFAHYDEIWAPSAFIAGTLAAVSPIPVVRMPAVLTADAGGDRARGRARLAAGPREFLWLFVFDFHSYFERKNPLALVEAFRRAFRPSDPVRLVVKCVNAGFDRAAMGALQEAARGHRISIHDGYWSVAEMRDLMAAGDGYASLHRSEGLGVPLANAMSLGKPVVATDWSGNADFMNVGNSFPVRYDLVTLGADVGPYRAGSSWADPSVDHAAEQMRAVVAGGADVEARTRAARETVVRLYGAEAVGRAVRKRLQAIAGRSGMVPAPAHIHPEASAAPAARPSQVSSYDFQPVLPPLDLQTSQHGLLGRLGKRAAALVVRYHTFHQQRVNGILASAIGDLGARLTALAGDVEQSRADAREEAGRGQTALGSLDAQVRQLSATLAGVEASVAARFDETGDRVVRLAAAHAEAIKRVEECSSAVRSLDERLDRGLASAAEPLRVLTAQVDAATARLDAAAARVSQVERTVDGIEQARAAAQEREAAVLAGLAAQVAAAEQRASAAEQRAGLAEQRAGTAEQRAATAEERAAAAQAQASAAQAQAATAQEQAAAGSAPVQALQARVEDVAARVAHVGYRFAVRPYMGVDPFGATGDLAEPMGYGPGTAHAHPPEDLSFEDVFRGPESLIRERQRAYLPLLTGCRNVVDLGCGRGEFLAILAEAGIQAVGVDRNERLVERCRARSLPAVHADALEYLRAQAAGSLDAVVSAQFIEHIPPEQLAELLSVACSRLRTGGLFIAETPNPESFEALKTFHVDLTHHKPIYPQVLLYMCVEAGFLSARIFYPVAGGFTQQGYETAGEYAVVATR